ncbi:hypothetical protein SALBM311S_04046 [Streptomyces alboniger]
MIHVGASLLPAPGLLLLTCTCKHVAIKRGAASCLVIVFSPFTWQAE